MTGRERLPDRRRCSVRNFEHTDRRFSICAGFREDGRLAEIFLSSEKPGSELEAILQDASIIASLALQFGCPLKTLRHALKKDSDGKAATILGAAIDVLRFADLEPPPS
jgi:hypothetical protein